MSEEKETTFVYAQPILVSVETSVDTDSKGNKKPSIKIKMEERIPQTGDYFQTVETMIEKQEKLIVEYMKTVTEKLQALTGGKKND